MKRRKKPSASERKNITHRKLPQKVGKGGILSTSKTQKPGKNKNFEQKSKKTISNDSRIGLPTGYNETTYFEFREIIRCESDNSQVTFHIKKEKTEIKIVEKMTMKALEKLLPAYHFMRVHATHIINLLHVKKSKSEKGKKNMHVILGESTIVPVSKRYKAALLQALSCY